MKKYIQRQPIQPQVNSGCTSDLGILSDPGSAKNPTVPSCQQKFACRFGSFSRMWKLKKKMLATKPSPTLFHEAQCYCWKKKTFKLHQGGSNSIRLLLAAGLPTIQQTCQLRLLEHYVSKVYCLQDNVVGVGFSHCKIIRRESKFDPNSCRTWSWSPQSFGISLYMNESEPKPTGFHVAQAAKCPGFR